MGLQNNPNVSSANGRTYFDPTLSNSLLVNDGTNDRVIVGQLPDGSAGINVSQVGVNVRTATNSQLIFNSAQDIFKIIQRGSLRLIPTGVAGEFQEITATHNLGYPPAFISWISPDPGGDVVPQYWAIPFHVFSDSGAPNHYVIYDYTLDATTNSTNIYFEWSSGNGDNPGPSTIYYYLLQETAAAAV